MSILNYFVNIIVVANFALWKIIRIDDLIYIDLTKAVTDSKNIR